MLFECLYVRAAVFVDEFGDEKDVVGAGKDGQGEDGGVKRREIVAGAVRDARGEDDDCDGEDLDDGVDFSQHRGAKAAKSGDNVDGGRSNEDEYVAADDGNCHPERDGKMRWERLREN